jgi:S-adenosyl-L-methionine hydrolase (adenosine-forming)
MQARPVVTFLSDYGLQDEFVGVCHGVIAGRCPHALVIDVDHAIPPGDVRTGALVLRDALPHMPAGVHLAVVDPGVGRAERRALALLCVSADRMLVGPDNGLLWLAAERFGGVARAVDIGSSPERREPVSATFHGRDIFAPVAAALACGVALEAAGAPVDPASVRRLALPTASLREGVLVAHVLRADRFGNLVLDASFEQVEQAGMGRGGALRARAGAREVAGRRGDTFADVHEGELLLYRDSAGMAALAVNRGSAAVALAVSPDGEVQLRADAATRTIDAGRPAGRPI